MKYLATFLLFTATVCHSLKLPFLRTNKEVALGDGDSCPGIFSCKDCNTVRVCHPEENTGTLVLLKENACPADRPWCEPVSGTCTDKEPPTCGTHDDFICLKKNHYFPDDNCHKFHYCDENYESKLFQCNPDTKVFNPYKQQCDDPSVTTCGQFDCKGHAVKKATHNPFNAYYAMCNNVKDADSTPLVVDICPDMYVLNARTQLCEPDCTTYGALNIPDVEDCHNYYHCNNIIFTAGEQYMKIEKLKCPEGLAYDKTQFTCVDQGTVDSCKTK